MKWETRIYQHNSYVGAELQKPNGRKFLLTEPRLDDDFIDDVFSYSLLESVLNMCQDLETEISSFYHVGFGFGDVLINMSKILPGMKFGGCELFDLCISYGHNHFQLKDYEFELRIKEYPYFDIENYDCIYLGKLPDKANLGKDILNRAMENAGQSVLFWTSDVNQFDIDYIFEELEHIDGWTLILVHITNSEADDEVSETMKQDSVEYEWTESKYKARQAVKEFYSQADENDKSEE